MKEKILNSKRILCTNNLIKNLRGTSWFVEIHVMLLIITLNQYLSTPLFKKEILAVATSMSNCCKNILLDLRNAALCYGPDGTSAECIFYNRGKSGWQITRNMQSEGTYLVCAGRVWTQCMMPRVDAGGRGGSCGCLRRPRG